MDTKTERKNEMQTTVRNAVIRHRRWSPSGAGAPLPLFPLLGLLACVLAEPVWSEDCNLNGIEDSEDVRLATSEDCNSNQVPDECEATPLQFGFESDDLLISSDPDTIAAGDLNGDGLTDLAVGNVAPDRTSTVSVLLNTGGGAFAPEVSYEAATRLSDILLADLDGDGAPEIVTVNSTVVLLFGNQGDGSFGTPTEIEVDGLTRSATALDLGNDGDLDLVTSNVSLDTLQIIQNQPAGTLRVASTLSSGGERPTVMTTADFNDDDLVDLAVANVDTESVQIFTQSPSGTLVAASALAAGRRLSALVTEDFDGDGDPDLAVVRPDGISVWLGESATTFAEPLELAGGGFALETLEVDGDGRPDLLVGSFDRESVELLLGRGDGNFAPPQRFTTDYVALVSAELSGDGRVDVAIANIAPNRVSILRGGATGSLSFDGTEFPVGGRPHGISIADFNQDGFPDVFTSNGDDGMYAILLGEAGGTSLGTASLTAVDTHANSIGTSDFDGDGDVDMMITGPRGEILVFLQSPDGVLEEQPGRFPTRGHARFLQVVDMDGDGAEDLVVPLLDGVLGVYFNDGAAGFAEEHIVELTASSAGSTTADFDGDGRLDVAVAIGGASEIALVFQVGVRSFSEARTIPLGGGPNAVVAGDFNRDGEPDLATSNPSAEDVAILINEGGGTFGVPQRYPIGRSPTAIDSFDVQGDGLVDVLTISEPDNSLAFLGSLGDGTFAPAQHLSVGNGPRIFTHADMDLDGDQDLIIANRMAKTVSLFLNRQQDGSANVEFLTTVCTDLDLHTISVGLEEGSERRSLRYLVSTSEGTDLPAVVFQNSKRFLSHLDFLKEVFPARYSTLTPEDLAAQVERRATRELFGGTISQLDLDPEGTVFGFSVLVDSSTPEEVLSLEEVRALREQLSAAFRLEPFGYRPLSTAEKKAAASWPDPGFPVYVLDEEPEPEPEPVPDGPAPTPTFELSLPERGLELCATFQNADAGRSVRDEYELKTTLRLRGGVITLPTENDRVEAPLFEDVRFGPTRELLEPAAPGAFNLRSFPLSDTETVYRFTYEQDFVGTSGRRLELRWVAPIEFRASGEEIIIGRIEVADEDFVTRPHLALVQGTTDDGGSVHLGSCKNTPLPRVSVVAVLDDGVRIQLEERFREADIELDTAAASLMRAEIQSTDQTLVIADYFDLVYAAFRHNRAVIYWLVLDPPATLPGVDAPVAIVELLAPEEVETFNRVPAANYLGSNFQTLKTLTLTSFERSIAAPQTFRRGDVSSDGAVDILDTITLLEHLFQGANAPCRAAGDTNDDGKVNIVDAVRIVALLFGRLEALPAPFEGCGADPTGESLECAMGCVP